MNKKVSKKNKYRDNLKLLFSMEEFESRVDQIREFLDIPSEMHDSDSEDKNLLSEPKFIFCARIPLIKLWNTRSD